MKLLRSVLFVVLLTACCAALHAQQVVHCGPAASARPGELWSDGSIYTAAKGLGWDKDLRHQARDRGDGCSGVALIDRDITQATFTIDLPDGDYLFDILAGDTMFTGGLSVILDGERAADPLTHPAGQSIRLTVPVTSSNGKASITFEGGQNGTRNSMIRSITITPASADPTKWAAARQVLSDYRKRAKQLRAERAALLVKRRAAYRAVSIRDERKPRQTIDLSGKWLFCPAKDAGDAPPSALSSDKDWHVMNVPDFWKPIEWWIYMEGYGTSHDFYRKEVDRCRALSFDYAGTNAGWYRQCVEVPKSMRGRRLTLRFDAVASVAEVYWNGKSVGSHVGMFGPFECEVTPHVKYGAKNLLTVFVSAGRVDPEMAKRSMGVAVTVNVTEEMLNSLPHGCYKGGMAGIWQPVSLTVTGASRINDIIFRPRLDGAQITTSISATSSNLAVKHRIVDAATGAVLYESKPKPMSRAQNTIDTGSLSPKPWSPEHPNLYLLKTQLLSSGKPVDEVTTTVGFKTFEARGNRLYLNGKPYFLRGANMPPHGIRPNDKPLADKFMKLMHDGNTVATRFHVAPPSKIWLDAADKYGVGASVGENWPWVLMGSTPIPDKRLVDIWHREFIDIVRAYRNHPSMMLWTISNESYFEGDSDLERRKEKYRIFSDLIKDVRKEDPSTPVVFHSGHVRNQSELPMLAENKLDDSDVDDCHFYFGWYQKSPFMLDVVKDIEARGLGTRPLISQEASTGYPDNDTGHPTRSYIVNHSVPQAWVGSRALYSARPDEFLDTHGLITKEYAERIRRDRTWLSGYMLFANCCWFRDVYDSETITPYPAYWGVRKAWQPVLVSLQSADRHFVAGQTFSSDVWVCNDDPDRPILKDLSVVWYLRDQSILQTSGRESLPDCAYDARSRGVVEFRVPDRLVSERANVKLDLELYSGDELISRNDYDLVCVQEQFLRKPCGNATVLEPDKTTSEYLTSAGVACESRASVDWKTLDKSVVVVVAPGIDKSALGSAQDFAAFVKGGGKVIAIEPRGADPVLSILPDLPFEQISTIDASGDFVEPLVPGLLDGLQLMDMHWWNAEPGDAVRVCRFGYKLAEGDGVSMLARHVQPHGYLRAPQEIDAHTSYPAFEVCRGSGRIIVSSLIRADDPIARRFWGNLVAYLNRL